MDSLLRIRVRRRTGAGLAILLITLLPFGFGLLNDLLMLPYALRYLLDLACMFLLFQLIVFRRSIDSRSVRPLVLWTAIFWVVSALLYAFHYQSLRYFIWGVRNNFRFYPFFLAAAVLQNEQDAEDCLKLFDGLFWINGGVCLLQYFCFGFYGDRLGGLFGTSKGCNGYMNIFFVIVLTKTLVYFLNRKEGLLNCAAKCTAALLLAAMAELKFFFLEFTVLVALAVLLNRFSWRSILVLVGAIIGGTVGITVLVHIFPSFAGSMTLEKLYEAARDNRGYTSSGDMNRLTFLSMSDHLFLKEIPSRLFGMGLGNCETSNFELFNTYFYQRYHWLHYTWLSTAILYLEMGYVGLIFLFGFFLLNYWMTAKRQRRGANRLYCQIGKILSVCAVLILIYNSSLRTEAAYMLYLVLAIPYIKKIRKRSIPQVKKRESFNIRQKGDQKMNENPDYFEIDFLRLLNALWRRAGAILLAGLLGAGIAFSCAALLMQPRYESTVLMYVDNRSFSPKDSSFRFNQAELAAAQSLVNSYLVILESRSTLDAVIQQAELSYSQEELLSMLEALAVDSTEFFEVTVTSTDPLEAQKIANTIAQVLPEQVAAVVDGSSIRVVDYAIAAEEPSSPNIVLYTLAGLLGGMLIACGVVVLAESQSDLIYDPDHAAEAYGIPVLGHIPSPPCSSWDQRGTKVLDTETESYKMLQTQLLFTLSDKSRGHMIGITSAEFGEGKTATALNLAHSLAKSGKKVLLLEADLRHPTIANMLHLKHAPGLSERLEGQTEEIIQSSRKLSDLHLIPAGETCTNPSEMLASQQMQQVLQTLAEEFDLILLDLPPVNCYPDVLSLSKQIDGFLVVLQQASSTYQSVEEALRNFGIAGAKIFGFVVTDSHKDHRR